MIRLSRVIRRIPQAVVRPRQFSAQPQTATQRFRDLSKKYGYFALGTYLTLSTTSLTLIFIAISNGIDVERQLTKIKRRIQGQVVELPKREETEFEQNQIELERKKWSWEKFGTTFLVAFAANKLLSPLKLMLTVMLTPSVARWWRRR